MRGRHHPDKPANSPAYGFGDWSCAYFDGWGCELLLIPKSYLTSCKGNYYSCMKQKIRHYRDKRVYDNEL
jgi:hypothetical protein